MMNMPINTILQWNVNGFHRNKHQLEAIIDNNQKLNNFYAISLQEIKTDINDPKNKFYLNNYISFFHEDRTGTYNRRGAGILVKKGTIYDEASLDLSYNSNIYAVAVKLFDPIPFTLVSIYIPPRTNISKTDLEKLYVQLPQPVILTGDFNGHSNLWDNDYMQSPCKQGAQIEEFIQDNDLFILNDGTETFHSTKETFSAIDLTLSSPSIALDFNWKTHKVDRDHFQIFIIPKTNNFNGEYRQQYILRNANWELFNSNLRDNITKQKTNQINQRSMESFTNAMRIATENSIPKTSHIFNNRSKPWWNKSLKKLNSEKKKAYRKFRLHSTIENRIRFQYIRALFRRNARVSRQECWIKFIQSIDFSLDLRLAWQNACRILGKPRSPILNSLVHNGNAIHDRKTITNIMADHLESISSSNNYDSVFHSNKIKIESEFNIEVDMSCNSTYNIPFTFQELSRALKNVKGQSLGPDNIHYDMLKNLDTDLKSELLKIFNFYWTSGEYPEEWRLSYNIPLSKPGKDPKFVDNLRFIALSSNVAKIFERMVNFRLQTLLAKNSNLLNDNQSGFRKFRQTYDNIAYLEQEVLQAFNNKEQVVAVFFDLTKAYDVTWRTLILKQLTEQKINGPMLKFLLNFLKDRKFQILLGNTLSVPKTQENGVPQGSVLSVTLFQIAINTVFSYIKDPSVKCMAYADDLVLICRNKRKDYLQNKLQKALRNLEKWCHNTGFKFSSEKTSMIQFAKNGRIFDKKRISLNLFDLPIKKDKQVKFLGMIIDQSMSWRPHIEKKKLEAQKCLQLFKVIAASSHVKSRSTLIALHQALVLSRIEYGDIIYGSAAKSWLRKLDPIHTSCLRSISGAHCLSYETDILIDNNMESLAFRREKHSIAYATKILAIPNHPLFEAIKPENNSKFENARKKPFTYRAHQLIDQYGINRHIDSITISTSPTWNIKNLRINDDMKFIKKDHMTPAIVQRHFQIIKARHRRRRDRFIYTDGSKMDNKIGYGIYSSQFEAYGRIPDVCSVYTAELYAILTALQLALDAETMNGIALFTDSYSSVQSLLNYQNTNPIVQEILKIINENQHILVNIYWIPSHMNIFGNEKADQLAKKGLNEIVTNINIHHNDAKNAAYKQYFEKWNTYWQNNNKYHNTIFERQMYVLHPHIGKWKAFDFENRRYMGIITRLRHGKTRLTHNHIFESMDPPNCTGCNDQLTVQHILDICPAYDHIRTQLGTSRHLLCGDHHDIDRIKLFLLHPDVNLWNKI